jgi:hypothetical protein
LIRFRLGRNDHTGLESHNWRFTGNPEQVIVALVNSISVTGNILDIFDNIFPYIAGSVDGSRLTAIWAHILNGNVIQAASSSDGGLTWSQPVPVSVPNASSLIVKGVVGSRDLSRLVALWDAPGEGGQVALCASSDDGGKTWFAPSQVPGWVHVATAATGPIRLTAVRITGRSGERILQSSTSRDGGASWSSPVQVSRAGSDDSLCFVTGSADGMRVMVGCFTRVSPGQGAPLIVRSSSSNDGGATWSALVDGGFPGEPGSPPNFKASADGKRIVAAWSQTIPADPSWHGMRADPSVILSSCSNDGGVTWSAPAYLSPPNEHAPIPRIAISADGTRLTVAWYVRSTVRRGGPSLDTFLHVVQAASSIDGGVTWTPPLTLSEPSQEGPPWPQVAASADGTLITAVWDNGIGGRRRNVQAAFSKDGGRNWSPTMDLSSIRVEAKRPQLTVSADGNRVAAVWFQTNGNKTDVDVLPLEPRFE